MGIALLSFANLFMPLQSLAGRWTPARRPRAASRHAGVRSARSPNAALKSSPGPVRPLRVVRMVDSDAAKPQGSRLMISGRMADVCAELERLAALEAAQARV